MLGVGEAGSGGGGGGGGLGGEGGFGAGGGKGGEGGGDDGEGGGDPGGGGDGGGGGEGGGGDGGGVGGGWDGGGGEGAPLTSCSMTSRTTKSPAPMVAAKVIMTTDAQTRPKAASRMRSRCVSPPSSSRACLDDRMLGILKGSYSKILGILSRARVLDADDVRLVAHDGLQLVWRVRPTSSITILFLYHILRGVPKQQDGSLLVNHNLRLCAFAGLRRQNLVVAVAAATCRLLVAVELCVAFRLATGVPSRPQPSYADLRRSSIARLLRRRWSVSSGRLGRS